MVQGPSWETNRSSAIQEIPRVLWNSKVYYRIYKSRPPAPTLSKHLPIQRIIYGTVGVASKPAKIWSRYLASPVRGKRLFFSRLQNVQAGSGTGSASSSFSAGVSFSRVKRPGRDANQLSASAAEFKNEWSYTFSPPCTPSWCGQRQLYLFYLSECSEVQYYHPKFKIFVRGRL